MMKPFRETWRAGRKWRVVADELGRIGRLLNNLVGIGLDITPNSRGGLNFEARSVLIGGGIAKTTEKSLQVTVIDDGTDTLKTRVRNGWKKVPGGAYSSVWMDTFYLEFDYINNGTVYIEYDKINNVWGEIKYESGVGPTDSVEKFVLAIAYTTDNTNYPGRVLQRWIGDLIAPRNMTVRVCVDGAWKDVDLCVFGPPRTPE